MNDPARQSSAVERIRAARAVAAGTQQPFTDDAREARPVIGREYVWHGRRWRVICRGNPFDRGPRRNVLLEDVITGARVVRPCRGLRREGR